MDGGVGRGARARPAHAELSHLRGVVVHPEVGHGRDGRTRQGDVRGAAVRRAFERDGARVDGARDLHVQLLGRPTERERRVAVRIDDRAGNLVLGHGGRAVAHDGRDGRGGAGVVRRRELDFGTEYQEPTDVAGLVVGHGHAGDGEVLGAVDAGLEGQVRAVELQARRNPKVHPVHQAVRIQDGGVGGGGHRRESMSLHICLLRMRTPGAPCLTSRGFHLTRCY